MTKIESAVGMVDWEEEVEVPSSDKVMYDAWRRYGATAQMIVAMEELGELVTAIAQNLRGRDAHNHRLIEELADAQVVIDNIVGNMGLGEDVAEKYRFKIERLWRRMQKPAQDHKRMQK